MLDEPSQTNGTHSTGNDGGDVEIRPMAAEDMDSVCELIGLAFAENPSALANVEATGKGLARPCVTPSASPSSDAPGATLSSPCTQAGSSAYSMRRSGLIVS